MLYTYDEMIWNEQSPKDAFTVVVTRSGFFMPSTIRVYAKKKNALLRQKLIETELMQDLRSVSHIDISTTWDAKGECLILIEGEKEYIKAVIGIDADKKIYCESNNKEALFN